MKALIQYISTKEAQVLSHNIRWRIMELLNKNEAIYAKKIAQILDLSEQKVHYHLNILRKAGLIISLLLLNQTVT